MRGRQLRAARAALGLTLEQLGDAAFVNKNTISRYESLDVIPPSKALEALTVYFRHSKEIEFDGRVLIVS